MTILNRPFTPTTFAGTLGNVRTVLEHCLVTLLETDRSGVPEDVLDDIDRVAATLELLTDLLPALTGVLDKEEDRQREERRRVIRFDAREAAQ